MSDVRRLPVPVTDIWDWQMRGSCRGMDSDLFFPPEGERGAARTAREARAKTLCRSCPVLRQCRGHALTVREPYGVWGGLTAEERNAQIRADLARTGAAQAGAAQTGTAQTGTAQAGTAQAGTGAAQTAVIHFATAHHCRSHGRTPDPWSAA